MTTAAKPRKPKAPRPLEAEVQKACMAILEARGWRVFRRNTGAMPGTYNGKRRFIRFAEKGQSDLYGFIPKRGGQHFECEIKRPGERPTLEQVEWLLKCHWAGTVAFWVSSAEECERVARRINEGGWLIYGMVKRAYPVCDKKGKKIGTVEGPSGDYELV